VVLTKKKSEILLPGGGPGQTFEAWLRVSGEDDVPWGAIDPVAQHHLQIKGKLGGDLEEPLDVRVRSSLVGDHEGVGVKNNLGKEVANEVFSQPWQAAESMSHSHWITLVFVN